MAERFNLTAQLQLQAPTNTRQVLGQIRSQLKGGINANVNVQANAKNVQQVNKALQGTTKNVNAAARGVGVLNKNLSEAARRFGVITLATGTMLSFAQSVKRAVGEAIAFERELVKISQVTGKSVKELSGLTQEITRLATGLGVSSSSLLETSRVLAQAGFSAKQTKQALDILAKTTLGPTFDDVTQTVEGAIAVLRQFSAEAARSGGEIKFLESTLDSINAVSKSFAVESSDLISVIRRVGGVFSSAGGSVNELIALFTSVRATTRESAETIATGLRTIFTRIQRTDTVNQLEQLGISLRDAQGNFVGAFEAVKRLSVGLSGLDPRNYRFSEIVESLGGFRQIGKVIPLIQQFTVAQDALNVAQAGAGSVAADALTAQQSLAVQVTKVREEFAALIRTLADSETFRGIASGALELARALIKIGEALEPVLPLLTSLLALKIGQGLAPGLSAIVGIGGKRKAFGGVIHKFAKGGYVPGSGNRDTVPAMLQPGEFVIKKSSAEKLGSDTLNAMNNNTFATGGMQKSKPIQKGKQIQGVGIFDSDMIAGGTKIKKQILEKIKTSKKQYQVISGPAGSGKTTFATARFGKNFIRSDSDVGKYSKFVIISGAGKTKTGDFSSDVQSLLGGATNTTVLAPKPEQILAQRQARLDSAKSGNLPDTRSEGALRGTLNAPTEINEDLYNKYSNVTFLSNYNRGGNVAALARSRGNLFEDGGGVRKELAKTRETGVGDSVTLSKSGSLIGALSKAEALGDLETYGGAFLRPVGSGETFTGENNPKEIQALIKGSPGYKALQNLNKKNFKIKGIGTPIKAADDIIARYSKNNKYNLQAAGLSSGTSEALEDTLLNGVVGAVQSGVNVLEQDLAIKGDVNTAAALKQANIDQVIGNLFESVLTFSGAPYAGSDREAANAPFDFPSGLGGVASKFPGLSNNIQTDAKSTYNSANVRSLIKKVNNKNLLEAEREIDPIITNFASQLNNEAAKKSLLKTTKQKAFGGTIRKYASGGKADTVPALLTPGEFVVNKGAAQSIGYSNLHKMNQTGVARFNTGGVVGGIQRFQAGGSVYAGDVSFAQGASSALMPSPPDYSLVQKAIQGNAKAYEDLTKTQKDQVNLAYKIIKAQNPLIGSSNAYKKAEDQVTKQWGTFYKDLQGASKSTKTFSQKISSGVGVGKISATTGGKEGFKAGAQRLDEIAGAAQQFAFLAGSATALAAQFGGLEESTSKAVTETAGFVTSIVGIGGTVTQLFTSLITSTGTQTATAAANAAANGANTGASTTNTAAVGANTGAVSANTQAQSASAIAGNKMALGFAAAAAIVVAVSATLKYFSAQAQAQADALNKAADDQLKAIESGTGSVEEFAETQRKAAELQTGGASSLGSKALGAGANAALVGGASGAAVGAAVGSIVPVIGTAVGAAVGGAFGALSGAIIGVSNEYAKQQDIAARFGGELEKSALNLGNLAVAQREFETALSDIDLADLQPEERVSRRLEAQGAGAGANRQAISQAGGQLQKALKEVAAQTGKSVSELTDADFKQFPELAAIIKNSRETISRATDGLAKDVSESRKTLQEAAKLELTGDVSVAELLKDPASQLGQALRASEAAIIAEAQQRIRVLQDQKSAATAGGDTDKAAQIQKQINQEQQRTTQRIKDQRNGLVAQNEEIRKNKEELARATAAQEAYRQSLLKINAFTNSIVAANSKLDEFEASLDNAAAISEGRALSFESRAPAGLSDLSQVGDRGTFEKQVDQIAGNLGPEGQRLAEIVKNTSQLIEAGQQQLIGKQIGTSVDTNEILRGLGLDPSQLTKVQFSEIDKALKEALEDGVISESEFKDIFAPITAEGEAAADALAQGNELINRQYQLYGKYVEQLQAQRDKEIAARQSLIDVQNKNAELMSQATGVEQTPAQKAAQRQKRAQAGLSGVTDAGGRQVQAGNVAQVSSARAAAKAEREKIAAMKKSGEFDKLSAQKKQELIQKDTQLISAISKLDDELGRLSDQSEAAADILGEIDKEKAKRETFTGIAEDFVFGGAQERTDINAGLAGVQATVATGTFQNQSEEQRKLTRDMLDRLADIQIPGTGGLTGKQVKQEAVFRDLVKMNVPPEFARAMATQTTQEEKLVQALNKLTMVMEAASQEQLQAVAERRMDAEKKAAFQQAPFQSSGGRVQYRNSGGTIFKPKGTDTVPAMLTPGEFVIRKSAVDKIGVGNLSALNSGSADVVGKSNGGVVYRQMGGPITAANVSFVGQTGGASFMTGSTYKGALNDLIRSKGIGTLIKSLRNIGSEPGNSNKKYFNELADSVYKIYRAGKFDFSRLQIGDGTAKTLDSFASNAYLFSKADASGFEFAVPPPNVTIEDYINQLNRLVAGFESNDEYAKTESLHKIEKAYSQIGGSNIAEAVNLGRDKAIAYKKFLVENTESYEDKSIAWWLRDLKNVQKNVKVIEDFEKNKRLLLHDKFGDGTEDDGGGRKGKIKQRVPPALQKAFDTLRASGLYLNKGGKVPSYLSSGGQADTVPAMLTPGEFVMSRDAVQKHGINKMQQLNSGKLQGFNKGGLVGGVQYKQDGGTVGNASASVTIDPSRVQGVFDNFLAGFSGVFDNIVKSFSGIQNTLTQLTQSMGNFTMQHTVTVEGLISIGGLNIESIKQELSTSIGQMVAGEVQRVMNSQNKDFNPG